MQWIWQLPDWKTFPYKAELFHKYEQQFIDIAGQSLGVLKHLEKDGQTKLRIELLRNEALQTSDIEGEYLDKDSLQSSIQKQFGLQVIRDNHLLKEQGVSEMLVKVYREYKVPLSHNFLKSGERKHTRYWINL